MNAVQRQFGRLTTRGTGGDDAKVAALLHDFENADTMLTKIIEASKAWRDSWVSILDSQLNIVSGFDELYNPIAGAKADHHGHVPAQSAEMQLERSSALKQAYSDLKVDLMQEVNLIDNRIIKPATDAKDFIQPIKKTIKKRENKRLDYERYQDRVNNAAKKQKRSDRENASLAKSEQDLAKAADEFQYADDHLRNTLPPIVAATFSILPQILAGQVLIQHSLLAQYYTALHNYCTDTGFPSPAPPMPDVVADWQAVFMPIQQETEALNTIARGKAVHAPMQLGEEPSKRPGLNFRNGFGARRASQQSAVSDRGLPSPREANGTRVTRIPSSSSVTADRRYEATDTDNDHQSRSRYTSPGISSISPAGDYFSAGVSRSAATSPLSPGLSQIAKKKAPPPPPPKRVPSENAIYVTALYSFESQEVGDLTFREGDRIRIIKKTGTTEDWWDGELHGQRGRFPANYCEFR